MSEAYRDQVRRVQQMASGSPTWDLSDNDTAALTAVLEHLDAYAMEVAELRKDKERLDKLEEHFAKGRHLWPRVSIDVDDSYLEICGTQSEIGKTYVAYTLRSAIDAAIEASQ